MIVVTATRAPFGAFILTRLRAATDEEVVGVSRLGGTDAGGHDQRDADFDDAASLEAAFSGARVVVVNATNYGTPVEVRTAQQKRALDVAAASGAGRVVLTSRIDLEHCVSSSVDDARQSEAALGELGIQSIAARLPLGLDGFAARDVLTATMTGALAAPAGSAVVAPAAIDDLGEAIARLALGERVGAVELAGPDALTWDDLAALASSLTGCDVAFRSIEPDDFRTAVTGKLPDIVIDQLLDLYDALERGWGATTTSELADVLGRPPRAGLDVVADAVTALKERMSARR
jgi:NAD(P)H dehydrogenase (quinone)